MKLMGKTKVILTGETPFIDISNLPVIMSVVFSTGTAEEFLVLVLTV